MERNRSTPKHALEAGHQIVVAEEAKIAPLAKADARLAADGLTP
jgi:hypothetical protein